MKNDEIQTIDDALRAIEYCNTDAELRRLSLYLTQIAWNDGGIIKHAIEEWRTKAFPKITMEVGDVMMETQTCGAVLPVNARFSICNTCIRREIEYPSDTSFDDESEGTHGEDCDCGWCTEARDNEAYDAEHDPQR